MRRIALILALWPGAALADGFETLTGAQVTEALTGRSLTYENGAKQDFLASGRTDYFHGRPSTGRWDVRGDQYCSVWPPSDRWACYDILQDGDTIRFVGASGEVTDGVYSP